MVQVLEIIAVIFSLAYLILLIKEKIACWFFGIAASMTSIYIFYAIGLYSEALLYVYYIIIGVYGYRLWKKKGNQEEAISVKTIKLKTHVLLILVGILLSGLLGYLSDQHTDAVNPYLDSTTTIFSFIASYLEAKKILSSWIFWLFINAATIILYLQQDLSYYLFITFIYFLFSIIGYIKWEKSYQLKRAN